MELSKKYMDKLDQLLTERIIKTCPKEYYCFFIGNFPQHQIFRNFLEKQIYNKKIGNISSDETLIKITSIIEKENIINTGYFYNPYIFFSDRFIMEWKDYVYYLEENFYGLKIENGVLISFDTAHVGAVFDVDSGEYIELEDYTLDLDFASKWVGKTITEISDSVFSIGNVGKIIIPDTVKAKTGISSWHVSETFVQSSMLWDLTYNTLPHGANINISYPNGNKRTFKLISDNAIHSLDDGNLAYEYSINKEEYVEIIDKNTGETLEINKNVSDEKSR